MTTKKMLDNRCEGESQEGNIQEGRVKTQDRQDWRNIVQQTTVYIGLQCRLTD